MSSIATAFVEIRPDTRKGAAETKEAVKDMATEATKTLAQFFSAAVVVNEFRKVIDAAGRLEQAVGGTEAIFGKFKRTVDEAARTSAQAMGISEAAFRELTSQIGGLLNGLGFTQEESAKTSVSLAQLGADLAATFGGRPEEAVQALGAALRGEFNPLERFGVSLRQSQIDLKAVELGLAESTTKVDANARAQAALALITEQTAQAQGQFGREADTAAGRAAIFTAKLEDARAKIGEQLLPIFVQAVDLLSLLVDGFSALPGPVQVALMALVAVVALAGPLGTLVTVVKALGTAIMGANPLLLAAGAAAVALAVIVVELTNKTSNYNRVVSEMADAMNNAGDASDGLAAHLTTLTQEHDVFARALDNAGLTVQEVADAALAGGDAWESVRSRLEGVIGTTAETTAEQQALQILLAGLPAQAADARAEMERFERITGDTGDAAASTATEVEALEEELRAVDDSALKASSRFDDLRAASDRLSAAFDDLIGINIDAEAAFDAVWEAAAETNRVLEENTATLDVSTEAGRVNREVLREQATSILDYAAALVEQGTSSEEAGRRVLEMTDGLRQQMLQAGFTEAEVDTYLATLGLTPENVTTAIETAGVEAAKASVQAQIDKLGELPDEIATEIEALIDEGSYAEAERRLNHLTRMRNGEIWIQTYYGPNGGVPRSAAGRYVDRFMISSLGEEGPEAVLPLTKPSRLAQLLEDERIRGPIVDALGSGQVSTGGGEGTGGAAFPMGGPITLIIEGRPFTAMMADRERAQVAELMAGVR
jgi:uncharacterized protein YoxC